jgi:PTS system nitrogen regulatory IIA component
MKLTDVLRPECVRTGLVIEDKAIALCEIAALAKKNPLCRHISEEDILEALQERETLGSTAFGGGVAIPHCRLKAIPDFVVGIATIPDGVDFESADKQKVRLIVFILAPADRPNAHIRLLSSISRTLQNAKAVSKMIKAQDAKSLMQAFVRNTGAEIPLEVTSQKSMLHVFVQDEHIFEEILAALSGLETSSMAVLHAHNAHESLTKIPLYAEFAKNGKSSVCRVIAAIAEQRLDNEIVRRIEGITGPLQECSGVMVTIQPLSYAAGSLEP